MSKTMQLLNRQSAAANAGIFGSNLLPGSSVLIKTRWAPSPPDRARHTRKFCSDNAPRVHAGSADLSRLCPAADDSFDVCSGGMGRNGVPARCDPTAQPPTVQHERRPVDELTGARVAAPQKR